MGRCAVSCQVSVRLLVGHWWREEVTLDVCASEFCESVALFGLLDSFGDGFEVKRLCELQYRVDEASAFVVAEEVVDESFVNLEDVDG